MKSFRKNKRGYFFIIDAILAVLIISIGVLLSFSLYKYSPPKEQSFFLSNDIINTLSESRVYDLNPYKYPQVDGWIDDGNISDKKNTILEQIGEFYYRNNELGCVSCNTTRDEFISVVNSHLIPKNYNFLLLINNETVYKKSSKELTDSTIIVPSKQLLHGVYDNNIWGPYVLMVVIWQ